MSEMVERVARALQLEDFGGDAVKAVDAWGVSDADDSYQNSYRHTARVAIEAMKEPTNEMVGAGVEGWKINGYLSIQFVWPAMIDEALKD